MHTKNVTTEQPDIGKIDIQSLEQVFNDLIELIQSQAREHKAKGSAVPSQILTRKMIPLSHERTETGICVTRFQPMLIQKEDWRNVSYKLFSNISKSPQLQAFRERLSSIEGKNVHSQIESAIPKIIESSLTGEFLKSSDLLVLFLKSLRYIPVSASCTIDVRGVSIKGVSSIDFNIGARRFTFRQVKIEDFEQELDVFLPTDTRFGMFGMQPPNSILRIEMEAWRPLEFQIETAKALVLLRLFKVCATSFGHQSWDTVNPFAIIKGATQHAGPIALTSHEVTLTSESGKQLERFWNSVEPKLPPELSEITSKRNTPLAIAYERYSDSLLSSHPIERKIAFAIMGLEAIYLPENEVQELMYRLQIRVCKALSKINFNSKEVRSDLKSGYKIRNLYVHGGHLSDAEKGKYENKGIAVSELASRLLDYLRISILHLVISGQSKSAFLELLEDSFIERDQDDRLQAIFESEKAILRI